MTLRRYCKNLILIYGLRRRNLSKSLVRAVKSVRQLENITEDFL